jgi:hypothetical protein
MKSIIILLTSISLLIGCYFNPVYRSTTGLDKEKQNQNPLLVSILGMILGAINTGDSGTGTGQTTSISITSFTPTSGIYGMVVTITGTEFSPNAGSNIVKFNGVSATVNFASATSLNVTVPIGAGTGTISVSTGTSTATSSTSFNYTIQICEPTPYSTEIIVYCDDFEDGSFDTSIWTTWGTPTVSGGYLVLNLNDHLLTNTVFGAGQDVVFEFAITNPLGDAPTYRTSHVTLGEPGTTIYGSPDSNNETWLAYDDTGLFRYYIISSGVQDAVTRVGQITVTFKWLSTGIREERNHSLVYNPSYAILYGDYYSAGHFYGGTQPNYATGFKAQFYTPSANQDPTWIDYIKIYRP